MSRRYPPINPKFPHLLHGGDYNPDQWLHAPEVLEKDMRLAKLAKVNTMTVGVFAWAALEPEEGRFEFGWLDQTLDRLADSGLYAVLATPSGARPAWMSQKYPEVLRVRPDRGRNLHGMRHNHCITSPVYREKTALINDKLAERYKDHPALLVWHVSNEYGGECHCELCQQAFRAWLKERYNNDLDALNRAWWASFWAHTFSDWSQIESPSPVGEDRLHGLTIDWMRFVTDQTVDFMLNETKPLRTHTPTTPITTNLMGTYPGLNYWKFAEHLDAISWDSYPSWHKGKSHMAISAATSFHHDLNRALGGGKPFMLMEMTPSLVNWQPVCKLKRPGMHQLSAVQAVAHGSDTVQYFQFRKSRGSSEKFHGAVVDHLGTEHNRVFGEVAEVGRTLEKLDGVVGASTDAEVAIVYDWENRWAIDALEGLKKGDRKYLSTVLHHHRPLWEMSVATDVIDQSVDLSKYKLVVAPMLYMLRPGMAERLRRFVEAGGTAVATYWTGIVNETDLCYLGGWPGDGLREVFGVWDEETDTLYPEEHNTVVAREGNELDLHGEYVARDYCALIHAEGADVLATYRDDFYADRPAVTANAFGKGKAYYVASRNDERFLADLYQAIARKVGLKRALGATLPKGVTATRRSDGENDFVFVMNFNDAPAQVDRGDTAYRDALTGEPAAGTLQLKPFGFTVLKTTADKPAASELTIETFDTPATRTVK